MVVLEVDANGVGREFNSFSGTLRRIVQAEGMIEVHETHDKELFRPDHDYDTAPSTPFSTTAAANTY